MCSGCSRSTTSTRAPGAADRGNLIHDTVGEFAKTFPQSMPDDPVAALKDIGDAAFPAAGGFSRSPGVLVAALPADRRMAGALRDRAARQALAVRRRDRRQHRNPVRRRASSSSRVRADRIECLHDGRYAMLDYKTGAPPSDKQVRTGLSPQLTLEAAILRQGGFKDIPRGRDGGRARLCAAARRRRGRRIDAGQVQGRHARRACRSRAGEARPKLLAKFADPATPYYSLLHPMWTTHYGTYDHLARVQEWSLIGGRRNRSR